MKRKNQFNYGTVGKNTHPKNRGYGRDNVFGINGSSESIYDIADFYTVNKPESGTKAIGKYDKTIEVEYLLTPTRLNTGKYIVEVKKIGDNLYQIRDKNYQFRGRDICIETRFCHEWTSFSEEVVLIVDSNYGYTKGKLIFD